VTTIKVTIEFDSLDKVAEFFALHGVGSAAAQSVGSETAEQEAAVTTESSKRKRRAKAEMEAARQAEMAPPTEVVPERKAITAPVAEAKPAEPITKDHVRAALGKVNTSKGIDTARQILQRFGTTSVSGLLEGEYAAFINECDAVFAGEDV